MTATRAVVPDLPNGRGPDWFALIRNGLGILAVIVGVIFFIGQRMETPEQKQHRIDKTLAPIKVTLDHISDDVARHIDLGGHDAMEVRMAVVEAGFTSLNQKMDRIIELLEQQQ